MPLLPKGYRWNNATQVTFLLLGLILIGPALGMDAAALPSVTVDSWEDALTELSARSEEPHSTSREFDKLDSPVGVDENSNKIPTDPSPANDPLVIPWPVERGVFMVVSLPNTPINESSHRDITIQNIGDKVVSELRTTLISPDPNAFSASLSTQTIPPGESATLSLRFASPREGVHGAELFLDSDDTEHGPFTIFLSAEAVEFAPTISEIEDQTILEDTESHLIHFTIGDPNTPASALQVMVEANDYSLYESLLLEGEGTERALRIKPAAERAGSIVITLGVSDGNFTIKTSFNLFIEAMNDPPTLEPIPNPQPIPPQSGPQLVALRGISAGPLEQQPLTISVTTDTPALFSDLRVMRNEEQADIGFVEFTPNGSVTGRATVIATVSDGEAETSREFTVLVLPVITAFSATIAEGNEGVTALQFPLEITPPHPEPILIRYATQPYGTAQLGVDYVPTEGLLTIPAGANAAVISVELIGDSRWEPDETFLLALHNEDGANFFTNPRPVGTILNDDAPPALQLSHPWVTVPDGGEGAVAKAWIAASLPFALDNALTWKVSHRSEEDSLLLLGPLQSLVFAPGETTKWLAIDVPAGVADSGERQFHIDFRSAFGPETVSSTTLTVKKLLITDFYPIGTDAYLLRFPAAVGQSYQIERSSSLQGPWTPASSLLTGGNEMVTQTVKSNSPMCFFRVGAAPQLPGQAP